MPARRATLARRPEPRREPLPPLRRLRTAPRVGRAWSMCRVRPRGVGTAARQRRRVRPAQAHLAVGRLGSWTETVARRRLFRAAEARLAVGRLGPWAGTAASL